MKKLLSLLALAAVTCAASPAARAQTAVLDGQTREEAQARQATQKQTRKRGKATTDDVANMQRRMSMNAEESKRDQQQELLEARSGAGNSSLSRAAGPDRQYDRGTGGFTVRKYRDNRVGAKPPKRGATRAAGYVDPKGKPMTDKQRSNRNRNKKRFLFF
ncbi:hypothetical protein [Hymenobacter psychrophilus]|uniref:DUF4890 domain-containing protein n=1 Tax=Hymenobacter psychrophilus TaxID=651662 RepID=A0A1H3ETD1_9BACT|nr:hypothetical protein [Hymenobacter psychrophilus]SDX81905.1 hypothetical protein SAMN04488069_103295 [Hymenobacter psychrophilus]